MGAWIRAHRVAAAAVVIVGLIVVGSAVYWFAPQRLVLDRRVAEALPTPSGQVGDGAGGDGGGETSGDAVVELGSGGFRSLEHTTRGRARIVELSDGSRFVRLEDLDTSNGPDLRVILSDQAISDDWRVWDDGQVIDLGALKGNVGDSNYLIPRAVELSRFRTVVIWCRRFSVGFGVAAI